MKQIEIYWTDLTETAQNSIRELLDMEPDDNGNWDVFPMAVMDIEDEE